MWFQKKRWKCEIPIGSYVAHNVFWLVEILKIFLSETTKSIELWLCRNDHWVVLYLNCESFADRKFKMATITSCIWPYNEHFCQVWFKSVMWFQKKRWKCEIPIGSYVKLSRVMAAILNFRSANDSQI
jgi:hypothetical protein